MLNPVALSIIVSVFTDRRERARAVGVWGSAIGITVAAGPVLGGLLVTGIGWRSVFWVNVPIGIAAIALTQRLVPESRAARGRAFDPPGQVLIVALFASVIAATIEGPRRGWADPWIVGLLVLAVLALTGMLIVEPGDPSPSSNCGSSVAPVLRGEHHLRRADGQSRRVPVPQHTLYL